MDPLLQAHQEEFEKTIEFLKNDLGQIRTGRANPAMIEQIMVDAYGTQTPIIQLGSISVPEARSLVIAPWDKNLLREIEKALAAADLGVQPVNEGNQIRLNLPPMTEENRQEYIKVLHEKQEKARVGIRQVRDRIRDEIATKEKSGDLTEDDKYKLREELDKLAGEYNDKIKEIGEAKEKEIMTI